MTKLDKIWKFKKADLSGQIRTYGNPRHEPVFKDSNTYYAINILQILQFTNIT